MTITKFWDAGFSAKTLSPTFTAGVTAPLVFSANSDFTLDFDETSKFVELHATGTVDSTELTISLYDGAGDGLDGVFLWKFSNKESKTLSIPLENVSSLHIEATALPGGGQLKVSFIHYKLPPTS